MHDEHTAEARKIAQTVYNLLGLSNADEVARWIAQAREELMNARKRLGLDPHTGW